MMAKYLQVIWLYVIGLVVILIGVYMLMNSPGPYSFVVMLGGLAVAAIGSAHGRKMRQLGRFGIEDMMREGGPEQPQEVAEEQKEEVPEQPPVPEEQPPPPVEEAVPQEKGEPAPKRGGIMSIFRRGPAGPQLRPDDVMSIELEDIRSGKLVPTEADVIELVCPRCNAENEEKNFYCYRCGNKLRRKPSKDAKEKKEIPLEPGSIAVVGDQRVAKVVICPKCNAANKQTDKFCFNCGKKLRSEKRLKKEELKPKK